MDGLLSYTSDRETALAVAEAMSYKYRILVKGADNDIIHDTGNERVTVYPTAAALERLVK